MLLVTDNELFVVFFENVSFENVSFFSERFCLRLALLWCKLILSFLMCLDVQKVLYLGNGQHLLVKTIYIMCY